MIGVYLIDAKKYSVKGDRKKARAHVLIQKLRVIIKDYAYYLKNTSTIYLPACPLQAILLRRKLQ